RICGAWLLTVCLVAADKKPVTIQTLPAPPRMPGITWAPDGKRFAWMEGKAVWQYDVPSKQKKQLIDLAPLQEKAAKPPQGGAFDWKNRRVSEQSLQWSSTGEEMLLSVDGDLFLLLTATAEAEHDPKLSPDGRFVSFRREHDLYTLEIETKKIARLTSDGSDTLL